MRKLFYYLVIPQSGYYTHHYEEITKQDYNKRLKSWGGADNPDISGEYILKTITEYTENGQKVN